MAHEDVVAAIEKELLVMREQVASLELALETLTGESDPKPVTNKEVKKQEHSASKRKKHRRMPAAHYDAIVAGFVRTLKKPEATFTARDVHEWAKRFGFYSTYPALAKHITRKMVEKRGYIEQVGTKKSGRNNRAMLFRRRKLDPKVWQRLADNSPLYGKEK